MGLGTSPFLFVVAEKEYVPSGEEEETKADAEAEPEGEEEEEMEAEE